MTVGMAGATISGTAEDTMVTSMANITVMKEHLQPLLLLEEVQLLQQLLLVEGVQLLQQLLLAGIY